MNTTNTTTDSISINCPITTTTTTNTTNICPTMTTSAENINISEMISDLNKLNKIDNYTLNSAYVLYSDKITAGTCDTFVIGGGEKKMINKDGYIYIGNTKIMPSVKEIKIIRSMGKDIGIKVIFSDDSVEKAICDKEDVFSYDYGLAICIMKKLFSYMSYSDKFTGTYYFNKIMDFAFKNNLKTFEEKTKAEAEKIKTEHKKTKNRLRKERQKAAKREAEIEIQKEAYLRAMNEFEGRK